MGRPLIDLSGQRFGKLTVRCKSDRIASNGAPFWVCDCDCGNVTEVERTNLKRGNIKSCGKCEVFNTYEEKDNYMIGRMRDGREFFFDKEDYEKVSKYNWTINGTGYVINTSNGLNGTKTMLMHRYIMDAPKGLMVDHINHVTYDNRKSNLRLCNASQNNINKKIKGYSLTKEGKYRVALRINGEIKEIGRFNTKEEALAAREAAFDENHKNFHYDEELIKRSIIK